MELNLLAPEPSTAEILENIHDGFVFYDRSGIIHYWNSRAEELMGMARTDTIGRNIWDCFPEETGGKFYQNYELALGTNQPVSFEAYFGRADTWYEVSCYPSWQGLAIFFRDVTERHRRQAELEEAKTRFSQVLKATSEAIADVDYENHIIRWHGGNFKKLFGYDTGGSQTADDWSSYVHPNDIQRVGNELQQALAGGVDVYTSNYRFRRSDGSYAQVHARSSLIRNASGGLVRIVAALEDVTAMEEARRNLLKSREDYERLFRQAPLPQCICSASNLRIIHVNDAAIALYGYSREEFMTMTPYDFSSVQEYAPLTEGLRQVTRGGQVKTIMRHLVKDGRHIVVELSATNVTYNDELCLLVTVNDITYERKLEHNISLLKVSAQKMVTRAQINAQEQEREEIGRELHDNINQQLTTIKLYIDLARSRDDLLPELLEKSESLLQGAIEGIRSLSKNLVNPVIENQDLAHALADLCIAFETAAGFAIRLHVTAQIHDRELGLTFFRVVQEQLTNISKYANATDVQITLCETDSAYELSVQDNGRGFDPRQRKSGIGLTNISNRVELFNGKVVLESAPGAGCRLRAIIPQLAPESDGITIAIAEDDSDDREMLETLFQEFAPGCRLQFAVNGMELLEQLRANTDSVPDLIVIDQNMPLLNGLDTLQALNLDPRFRRLPKVIYSTSISAADTAGIFATAFIEKASSPKGLEDNIRQMIMLVRGRKV